MYSAAVSLAIIPAIIAPFYVGIVIFLYGMDNVTNEMVTKIKKKSGES